MEMIKKLFDGKLVVMRVITDHKGLFHRVFITSNLVTTVTKWSNNKIIMAIQQYSMKTFCEFLVVSDF